MSVMHSGARQWIVECVCAEDVAEERTTQEWLRMHSQVSKANAQFFVSEDRLNEDLSESELLERLNETEGSLVACNVCGRLKEAGQ